MVVHQHPTLISSYSSPVLSFVPSPPGMIPAQGPFHRRNHPPSISDQHPIMRLHNRNFRKPSSVQPCNCTRTPLTVAVALVMLLLLQASLQGDHLLSHYLASSGRQPEKKDDEGWTNIQVFYGKPFEPPHRRSSWFSQVRSAWRNENTAIITVLGASCCLRPKRMDGPRILCCGLTLSLCFSLCLPQAQQDQIVAALTQSAHNLYFIDLAANDATLRSNTRALEEKLQWNGAFCVTFCLYYDE